MKLIKFIVCIAVLIFVMTTNTREAMAWAGLGHKTVAEVAQKYLSSKVRMRVEAYLGGQSVVDCAEWMDKVRKTEEYGYTTNWHVNYFDSEGKAVIAEKHGKYNGDALYGLQFIMPVLENYRSYNDSTVAVNLKFLIHLIECAACIVPVKSDFCRFFLHLLGTHKSRKLSGYAEHRLRLSLLTLSL